MTQHPPQTRPPQRPSPRARSQGAVVRRRRVRTCSPACPFRDFPRVLWRADTERVSVLPGSLTSLSRPSGAGGSDARGWERRPLPSEMSRCGGARRAPGVSSATVSAPPDLRPGPSPAAPGARCFSATCWSARRFALKGCVSDRLPASHRLVPAPCTNSSLRCTSET